MRENDAYTIYLEAVEELQNATKEIDRLGRSQQFLLRTLYAQSFSILEAYLYDRLRRMLNDNEQALKNYCAKHDDMSRIKYTPSQVLSGDINIKKTAAEVLKKVVFHRFNTVFGIYEATCAKGFDRNGELQKSISALESALKLRHDCVHRNGHDSDGNTRSISVEMLTDVITHQQNLADAIENFVGDFELGDVDWSEANQQV